MTAICFDLDGVLLHTMPLHAQAWQEALKSFGGRVVRRAIYEWEGEPGHITARTLLRQAGVRPSPRVVAALLDQKEWRFQRLARHIRVHPDVRNLLASLRRRKIRLALVTGTSSREVVRVVPHTVRSAFSVVVTGDRVRHGKPHPEPYRSAIRQLRVRPRQAVVIENAPYGIRSARLAGAGLVIALAGSLAKRFLRDAHLIVGSLPPLRALLERLIDDSRSCLILKDDTDCERR